MTGSMYAAIAGLKTHMSKMNVIGNNIANVNTNGYKSQRTIFKDAMYTMYTSGSDGNETTGGRNPSQIGYGSQISSIDLNMATGTYTPGRATDCMIYGDGFFLVGDKTIANSVNPLDPSSMESMTLTRVGDFEFKADGYLCDGSGNAVYGFLTTGVDPEGKAIVSDQLVPIRLPKMETVYKKGTETLTEGQYLALGETERDGYEMVRETRYPVDKDIEAGTGADGDNAIPLRDYVPTADGNTDAVPGELPFVQMDSISINPSTGAITGTLKDSEQIITIGYLAIGNVTNPNGVTHQEGFYYKCAEGAGDLQISLLGGAAQELGIDYVNGSLYNQAKADYIASPENAVNPLDPNALQSEKMKIGSAGGTNLMVGGLEGSNVDLASEISEMITTQRGYQANTRIITVTDQMLEELVNMKR